MVTVLKHDWAVMRCTVTMTLRPYVELTWDAEVDFALEEGLPFGLLGLEGFLNHWAVQFNAYYGYFTVERCDECHERQPPIITETLKQHFPGAILG